MILQDTANGDIEQVLGKLLMLISMKMVPQVLHILMVAILKSQRVVSQEISMVRLQRKFASALSILGIMMLI